MLHVSVLRSLMERFVLLDESGKRLLELLADLLDVLRVPLRDFASAERGEVGAVVEACNREVVRLSVCVDLHGVRLVADGEEIFHVVAAVLVVHDELRDGVVEGERDLRADVRRGVAGVLLSSRDVLRARHLGRDPDVQHRGVLQDGVGQRRVRVLIAERERERIAAAVRTAASELDEDGLAFHARGDVAVLLLEERAAVGLHAVLQLPHDARGEVREEGLQTSLSSRLVDALEQPAGRRHDLRLLRAVDEVVVVVVDEVDERVPVEGGDDRAVGKDVEEVTVTDGVEVLVDVSVELDVRVVVQLDGLADQEVLLAVLGLERAEELADLGLAGGREGIEQDGLDGRHLQFLGVRCAHEKRNNKLKK